MNQMEVMYQNALLAEAAYWNLAGNTYNDSRDFALSRGMTAKQYDAFVDRYEIVYHQPNTENGFSGTVFSGLKWVSQLKGD